MQLCVVRLLGIHLVKSSLIASLSHLCASHSARRLCQINSRYDSFVPPHDLHHSFLNRHSFGTLAKTVDLRGTPSPQPSKKDTLKGCCCCLCPLNLPSALPFPPALDPSALSDAACVAILGPDTFCFNRLKHFPPCFFSSETTATNALDSAS